MRLIVLIPGPKRTISCLETPSGRRPAEEFLYSLPNAGARIAAVLDHLAEHGTLRSPEKFKKLAGTDGIWELRHREARILCFHHAKHIVLAFGVRKKADRHRPKDLRRAEQMKRALLESSPCREE